MASLMLFFACQPSTDNTTDIKKTAHNMMNNPLLSEWTTEFGVPPFDKIKNEHYLPAIEKGIAEQSKEVIDIANNKEQANYKNTIEALELTGSTLKKVNNAFHAVNAAHTNDELKEVNKSKNKLFAILAHDLRGPISSFSNLSKKVQYLISKGEWETLDQMSNQLEKRTSRLDQLLSNLLSWILTQS